MLNVWKNNFEGYFWSVEYYAKLLYIYISLKSGWN